MVDRRTFVTAAAGAAMLGPLVCLAQPAGRVYTIGLLLPATGPTPTLPWELDALRAGLRDAGWIEGRNLIIETRWAGEQPHRQRELAAELKALPVAMILTVGTTAIASARDGAPGLPIVMINAGDPVGAKFVASLRRPGGDLTGTSGVGGEVLAKQVELLSAVVPKLQRVGVLVNSANPGGRFFLDAMTSRAKSLGLVVQRIDVAREEELDDAVSRAKGGALIVVTDPMFLRRRADIAAQALRVNVPCVFGRREYVEAGGLMSYVSSSSWHWRAAASFVDKILRGAKPADIPVEQPTKFELTLNLRTAKAMGLAIPQAVRARADEVIE